jgi:LysR family transcriptional regulator, glycine cleavage system transcriptional activator
MAHGTPPFNALYTFVITAKHLNFTNAAKELFVTQGAVSRQISTLENYLGFKVFNRHARGLSLTGKGEQLLPEIRSAFNQITATTEMARKPSGEIQLKAPTCSMRWLVPRLMSFQNAYSDIHVVLTTSTDHHIDFSKEDFDIGITYQKQLLIGDSVYKLYDEYITPVLSSQVASSTCEIELSNYTLLHPSKKQDDWGLWLEHTESPLKPGIKHQYFDTMELSISAAIQGFGMAIADTKLIKEDIEMGRLVQPYKLEVATGFSYYVAANESAKHQETIALLVNWLIEKNKQ